MNSKLRIMVALDGTSLAETILAALMPLARAASVELTLVRVAPRPEDLQDARVYLDRMTGALALHRIPARGEPTPGEPAPVLISRLRSGSFDFGAMTTHGRRGLDRLLMGSIAETVVRESETPVFVNRPDAKIGDWKRIVVALDGSPEAETVLDDCVYLARATGAALHLLHVSQAVVAGPGLEFAYSAVTWPDMKPYLADVGLRLQAQGLRVERETLTGPPGSRIPKYAEEIGAGLIAVTTHGRGGIRRALMGSVAEQVFRGAPCPILVRPLASRGPSTRPQSMKNPASR